MVRHGITRWDSICATMVMVMVMVVYSLAQSAQAVCDVTESKIHEGCTVPAEHWTREAAAVCWMLCQG